MCASSNIPHLYREAQARRGEEIEPDAEAYQDPDNETGLFAGMVYEADDEEADKIYEDVDARMDERRRKRRQVNVRRLVHHLAYSTFLAGRLERKRKPPGFALNVRNSRRNSPI